MNLPVFSGPQDASRQKQMGTKSLRVSWIPLLVLLLLAISCQFASAQENFLVSTVDGELSLFDLTSYAQLQTVRSAYSYAYSVVPSPDPRLAFVPGSGTVADLSIARQVGSFSGATGNVGAMTTDGKYLLVAASSTLELVDPAQFTLVKTVDLKSVLGAGPTGALVVTANNAYVFPQFAFPAPKVAIVNLTTFAVSSITLPMGIFSSPPGNNLAGVTPDGTTLVVLETETRDDMLHVVLISTATNQVIKDQAQPTFGNFTRGMAVTPDGQDPSKIFGYVVVFSNVFEIAVLDLRVGSPTYGQILPDTAVGLLSTFGTQSLAVNSDGSRLIVVGSPQAGNSPNVLVVDTAKMFTDPTHAIIESLTVAGGLPATGICTGFFSTTPLNTAPTVTGTSGDITNDVDNQVVLTGTNFLQGALVYIGNTGPLAATVNGSTQLTVTVAANTAAGNAQDIIVTNPMTNAPPDQQNQSGLLAGQFNIHPNPRFQPTTQLAATNMDGSLSVYDLGQQSMINVATQESGSLALWPAFNVDGQYLYSTSSQVFTGYSVLPLNLSNNTPDNPISIMGYNSIGYSQSLAGNLDPMTGKPVMNVPWTDRTDLHLSVIDSDPASQTFNTILRTFDAGINNQNGGLTLDLMTTSPDGKYAYLWYDDSSSGRDIHYLGIFNLSTGMFTSVTGDSLGVAAQQSQVYVAPDGKSLLLAVFIGAQTRIRVFDISNPIHPKRFVDITPTPIPGHGLPRVFNYQVIGTTLYGIDGSGIVVVFNFDRQKGDFRERGYSVLQNPKTEYGAFAFSTDGAYMYVSEPLNSQIAVLDTSKLAVGNNVLLTNIRSPYYPVGVSVSPVAPPRKAVTLRHSGSKSRLLQPQRTNGARVEPSL